MKKQILFIVILFGIFSLSFAQTPPDTLWTKTYRTTYSDKGHYVIQTDDGGFAIGGNVTVLGPCPHQD